MIFTMGSLSSESRPRGANAANGRSRPAAVCIYTHTHIGLNSTQTTCSTSPTSQNPIPFGSYRRVGFIDEGSDLPGEGVQRLQRVGGGGLLVPPAAAVLARRVGDVLRRQMRVGAVSGLGGVRRDPSVLLPSMQPLRRKRSRFTADRVDLEFDFSNKCICVFRVVGASPGLQQGDRAQQLLLEDDTIIWRRKAGDEGGQKRKAGI